MKKAEFEREAKFKELQLQEIEINWKMAIEERKLAIQEAQLKIHLGRAASASAGAGDEVGQPKHKIVMHVIDSCEYTYNELQ